MGASHPALLAVVVSLLCGVGRQGEATVQVGEPHPDDRRKTFVFFAGLEGTGHHAAVEMMQGCKMLGGCTGNRALSELLLGYNVLVDESLFKRPTKDLEDRFVEELRRVGEDIGDGDSTTKQQNPSGRTSPLFHGDPGARVVVLNCWHGNFDINLTRLPSLASIHPVFAVPCSVVCITLLDASSLIGALSGLLCQNWGFRHPRTGMMSYPYGPQDLQHNFRDKSTQHPDLPLLQRLCQRAGVRLRIVVLQRTVESIAASTLIRHARDAKYNNSGNEMAQLRDNAYALNSQLQLIAAASPPAQVECIDLAELVRAFHTGCPTKSDGMAVAPDPDAVSVVSPALKNSANRLRLFLHPDALNETMFDAMLRTRPRLGDCVQRPKRRRNMTVEERVEAHNGAAFIPATRAALRLIAQHCAAIGASMPQASRSLDGN